MIRLIFYAITLPLRAAVGIAGAAGSSGSRRRPRGRHYLHGYCTVAHRTVGAAERCAETARYRREAARQMARERQAIAEHNARLARQAADRAERRAHWLAFKRKHAKLLNVVTYLAATASLILLVGGAYMIWSGVVPNGSSQPSAPPWTGLTAQAEPANGGGLVIPEEALAREYPTPSSFGYYVYVVDAQKVGHRTQVTLDAVTHDQALVTSGLSKDQFVEVKAYMNQPFIGY
jgi:hypothetical protein